MSMTTVVVGKVYYGRTHDWTQNKDTKNERERSVFRATLNYRDRTNGEYINVDAVCWKDFGDKGGLVNWLAQGFLAEDGPKEKNGENIGGQPILVTGYFRPVEKRHTVKLNVKQGGKPKTIEVKDVPYQTFEFIIESADFVPQTETVQRTKKKEAEVEDDFDEIDADSIEVVTDNEEAPKSKPSSSKNKKKPVEAEDEADDDDDLFED